MKTAQQLIEEPLDLRPHVVLLGAGASRASFPNGDANGCRVPIMGDLVETLELNSLIAGSGLRPEPNNFEVIYGRLASDPNTRVLSGRLSGGLNSIFLVYRFQAERRSMTDCSSAYGQQTRCLHSIGIPSSSTRTNVIARLFRFQRFSSFMAT